MTRFANFMRFQDPNATNIGQLIFSRLSQLNSAVKIHTFCDKALKTETMFQIDSSMSRFGRIRPKTM